MALGGYCSSLVWLHRVAGSSVGVKMDLVELAAQLRDNGMSLAEHAQNAKSACWSTRYEEAILAVARMQRTVHVNDVRAVFDDEPVHQNAPGATWKRLIQRGVLVRTGQYRHSIDVKKHRHVYPVYESKIYNGRAA